MDSKSFISSWISSKIQDGFEQDPFVSESFTSNLIFKLIRNTIYTYIVDIENTGRTWSDMEISRQICGVLGYQQNENLMVQYIVEAKMKLWEATTIEGFEERIVSFRRHEDCEYKDSLSILLSAQRKRVYRVDLNHIHETDLPRYM